MKKWIPIPTDEAAVEELHKALRVNPVFCRILVQRGIRTYDQAKAFFRPSLDQLHDPFLMKDMDKAIERIALATQRGERILLYGDYDVDGTTCVALMRTFLGRACPDNAIDYYIPNRYKEGYGLSYAGIDYAADSGAALIIAMDCGIQAVDKVAYAKRRGVEVIICDHHLPGDTLPDAVAVLDPKRPDCPYPYKELSGCGVAFKLAQAYAQSQGLPQTTWNDLFDLLVISIGCDIVEMRGENRTLAHFGMKQINEGRARRGIQALIERSERKTPVSISDLVFGAGPMINAAGRLADAREAVRLLLSDDQEEAVELAESLHEKNLERREHERGITQEAMELLEQDPVTDRKSIVLFQPHWHKGVLGIAASKLVEQRYLPTIILSEAVGKAVGSARSVKGFNVHQAIGECADLLTNFGGHAHAAGLSMPLANVGEFKRRFEAAAAARIGDESPMPEIHIAADLDFKEISPQFWNILRQFAPFGPGNRRPVFRAAGLSDSSYSKVLKDEHLKLSARQPGSRVMEGIGFWMGHHYDTVAGGKFALCYVLEENEWKGKRHLQLGVKDVR